MFATYLELGITHILDMNGLDHLLFLVVLVIGYQLSEWKLVILLATAFTVGHSITLALAAMELVKVNSNWIEMLIAASIALTAAYNLAASSEKSGGKLRYAAALLFGLIHGLGFSNYFRPILGTDSIVLPLLSFNLGVELAQVIIVVVVLLISTLILKLIRNSRKPLIYVTSGAVLIWALRMVVERW